MAVYNGEPFIQTAIDSILRQTYPYFHFLVVDDCSTDRTREIVSSYSDQRVEMICLNENIGQTAALNVGLQQSESKWIARMDADDFSAPDRFEEQMKYLKDNSDVKCLGTFAWVFREDPSVSDDVIKTPLEYSKIQSVVSGSPIIHGSIVIDRNAVLAVGGYNDRYRYSADVELYDRFLPKYAAANLPKELLGVRRHRGQGSLTRLAFEEVLEISKNRLISDDYNPNQRAEVRVNLCRNYLLHSQSLLGEGHIMAAISDLWQAMKISPLKFSPNAVKIFLSSVVPARHRMKIKTIINHYNLL